MQFPVRAVEGVPFSIDPALREALRTTLFRLRREMRLSFAPLREDVAGFTISNLVGSIDIGKTILEVIPKTEPGDNWVASVLSLMIGSDAVDAAGERAATQSAGRPDLIEALGAIYAARLGKALRRDGPISLLTRERRTSGALRGKLIVSEWVRSTFLNPARFPQEYNQLSTDNDFSRALAFVAGILARAVRRQQTRAKLLPLIELLRPGLPSLASVASGIELRQLPKQWSVYWPAWSIAAAVLARRSLLGPQGIQAGVSIAIEPWPLLERLLERSLLSAVQIARADGQEISAVMQAERVILTPSKGTIETDHFLRPDGTLLREGKTLATFEAKYRAYEPAEGPLPSEIYQALAAARACSSPLAVLAYPGRHDPSYWRVNKAGESPAFLATIGLDMFSYRFGEENRRGKLLLDLVERTK